MKFIYQAKYNNKDFEFTKFLVIEETNLFIRCIDINGVEIYFENDISKIAFCERNAILLLIDEYTKLCKLYPYNCRTYLYIQRKILREYNKKYIALY